MSDNPPVVDVFGRAARDKLLVTATSAIIILQWEDSVIRVQPTGYAICSA